MGDISFWASFREPEVAQHRIFMVLITVFAFFEWGVRMGWTRNPRAALVLPVLCALGGAILLTHSHALGNVKEELLIEYTHAPLALLGVAAGWSRWLEVRLPGHGRRAPRVVDLAGLVRARGSVADLLPRGVTTCAGAAHGLRIRNPGARVGFHRP